MSEAIRFREVRKGERAEVLSFAQAHGLTAEHRGLRHQLSLVATDGGGGLVAAALCMNGNNGRLVIEIISSEPAPDESMINELADRCLRKVQAEGIGSARLHSPTGTPTDLIWSQNDWLDTIQDAPPPGAETAQGGPAQVA